MEVPVSALASGYIRVRVSYCGICGSDLHMRSAETVPGGSPVGAVFGHEFVGAVEEVAPDVSQWKVGDRVVAWPSGACGDCAHCRSERFRLCPSRMPNGIGMGKTPGALAESIVIRADRAFAIPDELEDAHAALTEPLAVALRAVSIGSVQREDRVAVIGAGPVGLITALALRAKGIENIVLIEVNPKRAERAREFGFLTVGLDDVGAAVAEGLAGAPSVIMECAGHPSALPMAMEIAAPEAAIVVLGALVEPVSIDTMLILGKELRILGSLGHTPAIFADAIAMLASRAVPADDLITGRMVLEDAERAFDELLDSDTDHIKILLHP
ncbi:alcohol dehydrogenase catalytic domain-containing protein [Rhodococcus sp. ABRD24]|uniref:zinc-dependent alcohol dehydrogenase n=1 Tax=Rhodococcus sp. ABRD24 TaxID=2507582 RepID=UPI0013F15A3A|nr:alcohol dehydrogenase catalytic domain-containing protein [Rhodococcus sp. ABRD24]